MVATLTLRTLEQVTLFKNELRGQISDGHWENRRPTNHWEPWCEAQVVVGENVGRNFYAPVTSYNLTDTNLLEVVGDRMIVFVKLARYFGQEHVDVLEGAFDLDGTYRGMPTYTGDYWDGVRAKLAAYNLKEVRDVVEADTYTRKDLVRDLREIKQAMKTWAKSPVAIEV